MEKPRGEGKKFIWGQFFTKTHIADILVNLVLKYKNYPSEIKILEPSAGTRNFVTVLESKGFKDITEYEIDPDLTKNPYDFFLSSLKNKFELIIGNPPFTKYNIKTSYYYPKEYLRSEISPTTYLTDRLLKKDKIQIENVFILKAIKHLKNEKSSIAFVLPISFFIKNKNKEIKKEIAKRFSTIIIYQNDKRWFDEPIPCCFAIFTNIEKLKDKLILLYENEKEVEEVLDKTKLLTEELIPKSFLYKKNNHQKGIPLDNFLINKPIKYRKSYKENNVSGSNILNRNKISDGVNISNYQLAIVRVGNVSVGKAGLIDIKEDILNDMFYVFRFKEDYDNNKTIKEKIIKLINEKQEHFRNLTFRVGSKSIKKSDILDLRIELQ